MGLPTPLRYAVCACLLAAGAGWGIAGAAAGAKGPASRCTRVAPKGITLQRFVGRLRPGSVGCLRQTLYDGAIIRRSGTPKRRITLTSLDPSHPATVRGVLYVTDTANYWTFTHLILDGRTSGTLPNPIVAGDYSVWRHDDVSSVGHGICFSLGSVSGYGCGGSTNYNHGIYAVATRGPTRITNNYIYDNGDRGIQLYPDADGILIEHNVIDGNGEGIGIGGNHGHTSDGNVVTLNVISNSRNRWNVEAWWPSGNPVPGGNVIDDNCVWADAGSPYYDTNGGLSSSSALRLTDNKIADPSFVDRGAHDFQLVKDSACAGYGVSAP
jgi:parallel beta-helix repeat protein